MSDGREADKAHLHAVTSRMLGHLLLLGATVLFGLDLILLRLPALSGSDGAFLVVPGTAGRHAISALAIPVVGAASLLLAVPGGLALAFGRRPSRLGRASTAAGGWHRPGWRRPALMLLGGVAILLLVLLRR